VERGGEPVRGVAATAYGDGVAAEPATCGERRLGRELGFDALLLPGKEPLEGERRASGVPVR
jgi:hypothetical protein